MIVIHMLSDKSMRLYGPISVHFRHVYVVYEIYQCFCARGSIITSRFPLQMFLEYSLQHLFSNENENQYHLSLIQVKKSYDNYNTIILAILKIHK